MNRFDRITAILIHLQSRKVVNASDLAERFDVSLRTIYRDIRTLEEAGVPIIGEAGIGYSIMDGYRLPPIMFTKEEASSFVAAEKLMEKYTDQALGQHFHSAILKIKAVLRNTDKEIVNDLENFIQINTSHSPFNESTPNALDVLLRAISEKKIVSLNYKPTYADDPTERSIEPVGIFHENQNWYVMAFCHLRNDYRQFRADRMNNIHVTGTPYTRKHGSLNDYLARDTKNPCTLTKVVIRVDRKIARFLTNQKNYLGFESEKPVDNNMIEMTFNTNSPFDGFARWFLMFADQAYIVSPASLQDRIDQLLTVIKENNQLVSLKKK